MSTQCGWLLEDSKEMEWSEGDVWSTDLEIPAGTELQYKYVVSRDQKALHWMKGDNFAVKIPEEIDTGASLQVNDKWGDKWGRDVQMVNGTTKAVDLDLLNGSVAAAAPEAAAPELPPTPAPPGAPAASGDLAKLTVKELKALLKEKGLPVSGKKAELVARLRGAWAAPP